MKFYKITIIIIITAIISAGLFNIVKESKGLGANVSSLQTQLNSLTQENESLTARLKYLKNPENLLKELKSEFNYRAQDEKLIILVPNTTSTR